MAHMENFKFGLLGISMVDAILYLSNSAF